MTVTICSSPGQPFGHVLQKHLTDLQKLGIATAYVSVQGLEYLDRSIQQVLDRTGQVTIVHGVDGLATEPQAMKKLKSLREQSEVVKYRVHVQQRDAKIPILHSKLYWGRKSDGGYSCFLGSSNLTRSGLTRNSETNLMMTGQEGAAHIDQYLDAFKAVLRVPDLVEPDDEFICIYEELHRHRRSNVEGSNTIRDLFGKLIDCGKSPSRIPVTQLDVVIYAMQRAGPKMKLQDIYREAEVIARRFGVQVSKNWQNSLRRVLNTNTVGKRGDQAIFERVGGEDSASGVYRLTAKGQKHQGKG